jgi:hypothetical protein
MKTKIKIYLKNKHIGTVVIDEFHHPFLRELFYHKNYRFVEVCQ